MGSKTFLFFCISLAVVLMITSEVAARELAETSTSVDNSKTVEKNTEGGAEASERGDSYGGGVGGVKWGGGGGGHCHCCGHKYCGCCSYPGQTVDAEPHN